MALYSSDQDVKKLIDIYLDSLSSVSSDAGWSGESILSRMIQYGGEVPRGTGNDQSNSAMINAIELLRDEHPDLKKIRRIVFELIRDHAQYDAIIAVLSRQYYVGICAATGRSYTDADRMREINQWPAGSTTDALEAAQFRIRAEARFRGKIKSCYRKIRDEIEKYDRYIRP